MQVHIKTDGDWTGALRGLAKEGQSSTIYVGIDGPFGAPAQRFYDFDYIIVLGSVIGITPFSGILTGLQAREERRESAQAAGQKGSDYALKETMSEQDKYLATPKYRRVDFHWIVKDKNYLLWFSDLLNGIEKYNYSHCSVHDPRPHLDVHLTTHVTAKRKNISTYVFRYLLECHRTPEHPASPLTGLLNRTQFGRPDLGAIMGNHYESLLEERKKKGDEKEKGKRMKVGVFFCGAPVIGYELADRCQPLTARGREEGTGIEYHFMMEVFG